MITSLTHQFKEGEKFTVEGEGLSKRGHRVTNGKSVKTGRPMKATRLAVFVVQKISKEGAAVTALVE